MATTEDAAAVYDVVVDTARLLEWSAGSDGQLITEDNETISVVPGELRDSYAAAFDQLAAQVQIALRTLQGESDLFPMDSVLAVLAAAGWDGALRDFKLQVLERSGRSEVTAVTRGGRGAGGHIRRMLFQSFMGALNAALDSLSGLPGIPVIKELKDFLERIVSG